jgi:hypothetical protein
MTNAASEPVRLKASTEILDRAGIRGGVEFDANVNVTDARPASSIIAERLARLSSGAYNIAVELSNDGVNDAQAVEDATVVEEKATDE